MHDPRIGRFFAVDPLADDYPHNSPYAFSENRVVDAIELEGLECWDLNTTQNPWQAANGTKPSGVPSGGPDSGLSNSKPQNPLIRKETIITIKREAKSTVNAAEWALPIIGGLVADDATGVGVVDDILIPVIYGGALLIDWLNTVQPADLTIVLESQDVEGTDDAIGFTIDEKRTEHIFRPGKGHYEEDNDENRKDIEDTANNGVDHGPDNSHGNGWHTKNNSDGSQSWAQTRNGKIINGGKNSSPNTFNPETGLSSPKAPNSP